MGKKKKEKKNKSKEEKLLKKKKSQKEKQDAVKLGSEAAKKDAPEEHEGGRKPKKTEKNRESRTDTKAVSANAGAETEQKETRKIGEREADPQGVPGNQEMAALFRIFADESRLQILDLLKDRELCAGDLLKSVSIVQSTLSHHMKVLVEAGIVNQRKQGKWSYYSINKEMLAVFCSRIMKWS